MQCQPSGTHHCSPVTIFHLHQICIDSKMLHLHAIALTRLKAKYIFILGVVFGFYAAEVLFHAPIDLQLQNSCVKMDNKLPACLCVCVSK